MTNNPQKPKKNKSLRDKITGTVEKASHKISNAGAPKIGQKIHDLGDKLEKLQGSSKHSPKV